MTPFNFITKILIFPVYYTFHYNFLFGWIFFNFIKKFKYKNLIFNLDNCNFPLPFYSSFIFKTYELNDRIILEKNLSSKNKCIIIGGGIGFIPTLTYKKTNNKILVFEINNSIIKNLIKNLNQNKVIFQLYKCNLLLNYKEKENYYYSNENFLATSIYRKTKKKIKLKNLFYKKISNIKKFNTLIIDGEGIEKHYIYNINKLKSIKHLFFEFHNYIFSKNQKKKIFSKLAKMGFVKKDYFINSYYFTKIN